jgi:hypothetical protein
MQHIIAFCTNNKIFNNNRILDSVFAEKFPGALWIPLLGETLKNKGFEFVTGDVALEGLKKKLYNAFEIYIIQEENSLVGNLLIKKGAFPLLIFSGESPLFSSYFYLNINKISSQFKYKVLFKGAFPNDKLVNNNFTLFFPSFKSDFVVSFKPWSSRKFLVMVASNKYWKIQNRTFFGQIRGFLRIIRDKFRSNYYTYPPDVYSNFQLHDKRLELIEFFNNLNVLDLYGSGWTNFNNLPSRYKHLSSKLNGMTSVNKHSTISNYKFALCLENMAFPGYVTEKIIDCLCAGVVPIYLGAPDIEDFIPKNLFIDLRDFKSLIELDVYLNNFSEDSSNQFFKNAQAFLNDSTGKKFSFENFSYNISELILKQFS